MKRNILIVNGIWLIVAIAAFALGRYDSSAPGTGNQASSAGRPIGKSDTSANSGKPAKDGSEEASTSGKSADFKAAEAIESESTRILTEDEMRQAVLNALKEPNPLKSNLLFAQLLAQLTPENVEVAMETLRENGDGRTMFQQMGLLTYAFGAMDGEKAMEYAQGIEGRGSVFTSASALSGWASKNPQAALAWLQGQEELDGMEKAMFARGLVNGLAQTNLDMATVYAGSMDDPEMQRQFFDVIAREQMKGGIEKAKAWLNGLSDDNAKTSALENIARQVVRDDPDQAVALALEYADKSYGVRAIAEIADEIAERDPNESLALVKQLPPGEAQNKAMAAAFKEYTRKNFEEANALLNDMAPGALRDYATLSFIDEAKREDLKGALALTETIADPKVREQSQIMTLGQIYRVDPDSALQQAAAFGMSPESQQKLIETAERRSDYGGRGPGGFGDRGPGGGDGRGPGGPPPGF